MSSEQRSLSHIDQATGNAAMVDVSNKAISRRSATAQAIVMLGEEITQHLLSGDIQTKKGSVFQTAIIAGTMGAKKTADLIPLCHPLMLEDCKINIAVNEHSEAVIKCTVSITSKTGVEMEALTGVTIAALTVYDMCKGFSHNIIIKEVKLLEKTGGKSDFSSK